VKPMLTSGPKSHKILKGRTLLLFTKQNLFFSPNQDYGD
jgi:hypothetical protein